MIYSWAFRTTLVTAGVACVEINTPSTQSIRIYEVGVTQVVGTGCVVGLGKALAASVGPTTPIATAVPLPEQDTALPAAKTVIYTAWATSSATMPLVTSNYYRRVSIIGLIGAGVVWTFPRGLYVPPSASGTSAVCLFNCTATTGFLDVWIVFDE
jgi:hypothetical protein